MLTLCESYEQGQVKFSQQPQAITPEVAAILLTYFQCLETLTDTRLSFRTRGLIGCYQVGSTL